MEKTMLQTKLKPRLNQQKHRAIKQELTSYAFVGPYFLLFFLFTVLPVGMSIALSFTSFNMIEMPTFIGAANYTRLFFGDDIFIKSIGNTFMLSLFIGPIGYCLCLLFAWFINELRPWMRAMLTVVFYAPSISGNIYLVWQILFSGDSYGYVNGVLMNLGFISQPILWLKDSNYMMDILILVGLWSSLSTSFLAFVAGFQGVDRCYYEAASIDGVKNRWQELWFVTLPMMRPQMMFGAVMSITGSFGIGSIATEMMGFPSTDYATHTMVNHLEDYGSIRYEMGYASAIATLLFLIMILSNAVVRRLLSKVGT